MAGDAPFPIFYVCQSVSKWYQLLTPAYHDQSVCLSVCV